MPTLLRKIILITILLVYPVSFFFWEATMESTGLFLIAIFLVSLKTWQPTRVLLILSPIFLFLATHLFINSIDWFLFLFITYVLIFPFLLKNFWKWVDPPLRKIFPALMVVFLILILTIGGLPAECYYVSGAEKGVSEGEISLCKFFNLYQPHHGPISGTFSGFAAMNRAFSIWPSLFASFVMFVMFLYFNEKALDKKIVD